MEQPPSEDDDQKPSRRQQAQAPAAPLGSLHHGSGGDSTDAAAAASPTSAAGASAALSIAAAASAPGSEPRYVLELNPSDVLLGRGAPTISYEGNVRFRELVRTRKDEYMDANRNRAKDVIAREVVLEIIRRKGRFLRRVDPSQVPPHIRTTKSTSQSASSSSSSKKKKTTTDEDETTTKVWVIADEEAVIEKVKQALRDKEPLPSLPPVADTTTISQADAQQLSSEQEALLLQSQHSLPPYPLHRLSQANNVMSFLSADDLLLLASSQQQEQQQRQAQQQLQHAMRFHRHSLPNLLMASNAASSSSLSLLDQLRAPQGDPLRPPLLLSSLSSSSSNNNNNNSNSNDDSNDADIANLLLLERQRQQQQQQHQLAQLRLYQHQRLAMSNLLLQQQPLMMSPAAMREQSIRQSLGSLSSRGDGGSEQRSSSTTTTTTAAAPTAVNLRTDNDLQRAALAAMQLRESLRMNQHRSSTSPLSQLLLDPLTSSSSLPPQQQLRPGVLGRFPYGTVQDLQRDELQQLGVRQSTANLLPGQQQRRPWNATTPDSLLLLWEEQQARTRRLTELVLATQQRQQPASMALRSLLLGRDATTGAGRILPLEQRLQPNNLSVASAAAAVVGMATNQRVGLGAGTDRHPMPLSFSEDQKHNVPDDDDDDDHVEGKDDDEAKGDVHDEEEDDDDGDDCSSSGGDSTVHSRRGSSRNSNHAASSISKHSSSSGNSSSTSDGDGDKKPSAKRLKRAAE